MRDQFREAIEAALNDGFATLPLSEGSRPLLERAMKQRIGAVSSSHLTVKSDEEAKQNTLSAKYGAGEFPHHTDFAFRPYPPRLVVLVNEMSETHVRPTKITRFTDLTSEVRLLHSKTLWNLKTKVGSFVVGGKTALGQHTIHRWDAEFLSPANRAAYVANGMIRRAISEAEIVHVWKPHCALIVDNWNCTHSRGAVLGLRDESRRLLRIEAWHHAGVDY